MTLEPQEIVSGKNLAAKSSEVDFAIVLSRVIVSIENDPAQFTRLMNVWRDIIHQHLAASIPGKPRKQDRKS